MALAAEPLTAARNVQVWVRAERLEQERRNEGRLHPSPLCIGLPAELCLASKFLLNGYLKKLV